ncbi:MAG: GNAT family N-acetyltransferase [Oscillospiraceae bacterium]|nr:GNAT family N-acetyltransferase [Oscillospiraceae bacterium]
MDKATSLRFRIAVKEDCALILQFIRELAKYENLEDAVVATEEGLEDWLFNTPSAEVIFAVVDDKEVGFALYFTNFSTFLGKAGLYLEDLYVQLPYRGRGIGKAMLKYLAKMAVACEFGRLDWACLDWNKDSIAFYESLGAEALSEWTTYRLSGETLEALANAP